MEMKPITLCGVPALAWGKDSDRRMLAVHGMMSHKADEPIQPAGRGGRKAGYPDGEHRPARSRRPQRGDGTLYRPALCAGTACDAGIPAGTEPGSGTVRRHGALASV